MTFSELKTPGGYLCGEVASALQKTIRRGLEQEALFWATELDLAGYGEYLWKRLRIIVSEDIGLAEPNLPAQVRSLYENWLDQRKKADERHGPERLFLVHAIILMARASKSRLVDHALIWAYEARETHSYKIPDYALDKHTIRGRRLRRGHAHFWAEGAQVANAVGGADPYEATARATRIDQQSDLELI